jgi:hypothetical protein
MGNLNKYGELDDSNCPKCGSPIKPNWKACPECGEMLRPTKLGGDRPRRKVSSVREVEIESGVPKAKGRGWWSAEKTVLSVILGLGALGLLILFVQQSSHKADLIRKADQALSRNDLASAARLIWEQRSDRGENMQQLRSRAKAQFPIQKDDYYDIADGERLAVYQKDLTRVRIDVVLSYVEWIGAVGAKTSDELSIPLTIDPPRDARSNWKVGDALRIWGELRVESFNEFRFAIDSVHKWERLGSR